MRIVLLGPPGAGKGTQGQRLAAAYNVPHVATGDLIRDHIARGTEFGRAVQAAIAQGNFAPDADVLYWVCDRLSQPDARQGYVLDGFPRNPAQAQAFDERNSALALPLDAVIDLEIDEAKLIERLAGRWVCPQCDEIYHLVHHPPRAPGVCDCDGTPLVRRPDDEPEAIRRRLKIYDERTLPLRSYYQKQGLLIAVDASGNADEVYARITAALGAHEKEHFQV